MRVVLVAKHPRHEARRRTLPYRVERTAPGRWRRAHAAAPLTARSMAGSGSRGESAEGGGGGVQQAGSVRHGEGEVSAPFRAEYARAGDS